MTVSLIADVAGASVEWAAPLFWPVCAVVVAALALAFVALRPQAKSDPDRGGVSGLSKYWGGR